MKKYESEIRVIYADTDAMGIVYHANYIKWFEVGRTALLRQIGFPYSTLEKEGIWLPVIEVNCVYKLPAVYDDMLTIHAWIAEQKAATVILNYEIFRKETGELLVTGRTKHAVTDEKLRPIRLKTKNPKLYESLIAGLEE